MYWSSSIRAHHSIITTTFPISNSSTFPHTKHHRTTRRNPLFSARSIEFLRASSSEITVTTVTTAMSPSEEVAHDFSPFLKIYKDGHSERLVGVDFDFVPPSLDPVTGVESRDAVISAETGLSARLYLPPIRHDVNKKLPVVIYFHGGGFCVETPFCAKYHSAVTSLVAESNAVAISVDYRLAPENPVPIPHEDSWAAVLWAAAHAGGAGPDEWLNSRADFSRVYFAGDSAGANIAHNLAVRAGKEAALGVGLAGVVLVHPYFWGSEPVGAESVEPERRAMAEGLWRFVCPGSRDGTDDVLINPAKDPSLGRFGSERVLVCVAEKDGLRERGWFYKETLEKSGWAGTVEMLEAQGDDHVFHLANPTCDNAVALVKKIASFVNQI